MHNPSLFPTKNSFNVLYTTDVQKTHNFYKNLGLKIKQFEEDKVVINFGSFDLHFILNSTEPFDAYQYITSPDKYGQGIIFYVETSDIVEAKNIIQESGGSIKADVFENKWNYLELLFEDPNGYKFALYQEE